MVHHPETTASKVSLAIVTSSQRSQPSLTEVLMRSEICLSTTATELTQFDFMHKRDMQTTSPSIDDYPQTLAADWSTLDTDSASPVRPRLSGSQWRRKHMRNGTKLATKDVMVPTGIRQSKGAGCPMSTSKSSDTIRLTTLFQQLPRRRSLARLQRADPSHLERSVEQGMDSMVAMPIRLLDTMLRPILLHFITLGAPRILRHSVGHNFKPTVRCLL